MTNSHNTSNYIVNSEDSLASRRAANEAFARLTGTSSAEEAAIIGGVSLIAARVEANQLPLLNRAEPDIFGNDIAGGAIMLPNGQATPIHRS